MSLTFIGKKRAMTQIFDKKGKAIACTILVVDKNIVTEIKNKDRDGYTALQLGSCEIIKSKKINKPLGGNFRKKGVKPFKYLKESRIDKIDGYKIGQEVSINHFSQGDFIDATGVSKGKGYQGVMKLYGFKGGPASHGSGFHRHAGSTGAIGPVRCFPGGKRASQMGNKQVTTQNLKILLVDETKNLIVVAGAIPGAPGSVVYINKAKKKVK